MSFCARVPPVLLPCSIRLASMATQIPQISEVERISPLIIRILGGNPSKFTLQGQIRAGIL